MTIIIGADHRGQRLAETLETYIEKLGHTVKNVSSPSYNGEDDYVDYALPVGKGVTSKEYTMGIVICGGGTGVCVAANKIPGIRATLGFDVSQVTAARTDDDANVLALAADFLTNDTAQSLVQAFLATPFSGYERHKRRIQKITEIEKQYGN